MLWYFRVNTQQCKHFPGIDHLRAFAHNWILWTAYCRMYSREQKFFFKVRFSTESTLIAEHFNDNWDGKSRILGIQDFVFQILFWRCQISHCIFICTMLNGSNVMSEFTSLHVKQVYDINNIEYNMVWNHGHVQ